MNLSRYILKYSTDDGTLYFNTKTNHSFFLTNELNAKPRVFNYNCDCK